ncbi:hypothetical protein EON63_08105 [archaeon]|nr:MAG: hypothetical protein EON63_08105 [archaeon]
MNCRTLPFSNIHHISIHDPCNAMHHHRQGFIINPCTIIHIIPITYTTKTLPFRTHTHIYIHIRYSVG